MSDTVRPVSSSNEDPWDQVELIRPAQLLLSGLAPPPTVAERAFMELARQWHRDFRQLGKSATERSTDIRALSCLLLALNHGQDFSRASMQQVRANWALAESFRREPWVDTLTWKLCIVSMNTSDFGKSSWAGELMANLSHPYSPVRRWIMEVAWLARARLRSEVAVPQLLTNLADKLECEYDSAGLAAAFFKSDDDFWNAAKAFAPRDEYAEQYRDRIESVIEFGLLELQASFWKLEVECHRAIGEAVYDERLVRSGSEQAQPAADLAIVDRCEGDIAVGEPSARVEWAPDFGAYLGRKGLLDVAHCFYDIAIDRIDVIGMRHFTIMVNHQFEGVVYALSLDYEVVRLAELMSFVPQPVRTRVADSVVGGTQFPFTIPLGLTLTVNVEARVGQLQVSDTEVFAPLVVQRFFRKPGARRG